MLYYLLSINLLPQNIPLNTTLQWFAWEIFRPFENIAFMQTANMCRCATGLYMVGTYCFSIIYLIRCNYFNSDPWPLKYVHYGHILWTVMVFCFACPTAQSCCIIRSLDALKVDIPCFVSILILILLLYYVLPLYNHKHTACRLLCTLYSVWLER